MSQSSKKWSPGMAAVTSGVSMLFLFWVVIILGVAIGNGWNNLNNLWITYLIASVIISIFVSLIMFLTTKYGLAFISWCFVGFGLLIFFASAKVGWVSILITKYLFDAFDVNMLASSIGVIAFGFGLYEIEKSRKK